MYSRDGEARAAEPERRPSQGKRQTGNPVSRPRGPSGGREIVGHQPRGPAQKRERTSQHPATAEAGAVEGLAEAGIYPDWIVGISIGAINSTLIAGNPPEKRVAVLREFWERASAHSPLIPPSSLEGDALCPQPDDFCSHGHVPHPRRFHAAHGATVDGTRRQSGVICRSGQRAYYAKRMLLQNGFKARTLSGGMLSRVHSFVLTN